MISCFSIYIYIYIYIYITIFRLPPNSGIEHGTSSRVRAGATFYLNHPTQNRRNHDVEGLLRENERGVGAESKRERKRGRGVGSERARKQASEASREGGGREGGGEGEMEKERKRPSAADPTA